MVTQTGMKKQERNAAAPSALDNISGLPKESYAQWQCFTARLDSFSSKLEKPINIRKMPRKTVALLLKNLIGLLAINEIPESAGRVPIQKDVSSTPPHIALFVATAINIKPYNHPHGSKGLSKPIKKLETE